jgi:hypothetical protein
VEKFATGVNVTSGKFATCATGAVGTSDFATGTNNISGKFATGVIVLDILSRMEL